MYVCASVREDNPQALAELVDHLPVQTHKPYNNLLIAPACICLSSIARYLTLNIGISIFNFGCNKESLFAWAILFIKLIFVLPGH